MKVSIDSLLLFLILFKSVAVSMNVDENVEWLYGESVKSPVMCELSSSLSVCAIKLMKLKLGLFTRLCRSKGELGSAIASHRTPHCSPGHSGPTRPPGPATEQQLH